jgi:aspartate racemase
MTEPKPLQKKTCCLGLLGGLGVGAAIHYYKELALAVERQGRALDLVMAHAQTSRVFEYVDAGDREGLGAYLNGFIVRLQAAGAEFAVIPAATPHYCIRELVVISPLPVLSIFEPLNREIAARAIRRVSVFGTRQVMRSSLYGQAEGVEVVPHPGEEVEAIHTIYQTLLETASGAEQQHRELTALAHAVLDRDRVDAIVLAGTDLTLVFNETNTDFPYLDCAGLHLRAIEARLLG